MRVTIDIESQIARGSFWCAGCGRRRKVDIPLWCLDEKGHYTCIQSRCPSCRSKTITVEKPYKKNGKHRSDHNQRRHYQYARLMKEIAGEFYEVEDPFEDFMNDLFPPEKTYQELLTYYFGV